MLKFLAMRFPKFLAAKSEWFVLIFLLAVFAALKISVLAPHFADGWIYFYFGKLVAGGATPYLDFYYSSPPLIPYLMGFLHALFGFKISLANFLPTIFSLVDAILIFVLVKKRSPFFALVAVVAYLFSFLNFATTDYFSEAHPLTSFALAGILFFENRKFFWSGIFFGLAGLTKFYGILPAVFLPILIFREPRNLRNFFAGIFASFAVPNLIFLAIVGREYLDLIFFNHFEKVVGISKSKIFAFFFAKDFWLIAVAPLILFARNFKKTLAPIFALAALVIFYALFADIYYLYLKIALAIFVVAIGFSLAGNFRKISSEKITSLILILIFVNSLFAISNYFGAQNQKARIENLPQIVAEVRRFDRPIFGDFEIAPLVALLSEKNIFQNIVDTNSKLIALGVLDPTKISTEISAAGGVTVLTKNFVDSKIHGLENLLPEKYFAENCSLEKSFPLKNDYEDNAIIVWSCE